MRHFKGSLCIVFVVILLLGGCSSSPSYTLWRLASPDEALPPLSDQDAALLHSIIQECKKNPSETSTYDAYTKSSSLTLSTSWQYNFQADDGRIYMFATSPRGDFWLVDHVDQGDHDSWKVYDCTAENGAAVIAIYDGYSFD